MQRNNKNIVLWILIVAIVIIIGFLGYKFLTSSKKNDNAKEKDKYAEYNGYSYLLSNDISYKILKNDNNESLLLYEIDGNYTATISLINKEYLPLDDYNKLEELLNSNSNNVKIKNRKILMFDDKELVSFEMNGENSQLVAYMLAYDDYVYGINIVTEDNLFDYVALEKIGTILNSGKKS